MKNRKKNTYSPQERYEFGRIVAYFIEHDLGREWRSLQEDVRWCAVVLGVATVGHTRTQMAARCAMILKAKGLEVPPDYVPPWMRKVAFTSGSSPRLGGRV